jgi:hypothetical protein
MDSEDIVRKFHQKRGRIRDQEKIHPGSRIQGVKKHRIPDPDPQHCTGISLSTEFASNIGTSSYLLDFLFQNFMKDLDRIMLRSRKASRLLNP